MSWFDRFGAGRSQPAAAPEILRVPLFPLRSVLFPGGRLPLRVFEPRYLTLTSECMRQQGPFGICLIASGQEVGAAATPHAIGTLAEIESWDMERSGEGSGESSGESGGAQPGILQLVVRGGRRFRILSSAVDTEGLLRAEVELLPEPPAQPVPEAQAGLLAVLRQVAADLGPERMPPPYAWDDAAWVGYRLAEVMPVQALAKQKLLELDDAVSRLEILFRFLEQRGLVR